MKQFEEFEEIEDLEEEESEAVLTDITEDEAEETQGGYTYSTLKYKSASCSSNTLSCNIQSVAKAYVGNTIDSSSLYSGTNVTKQSKIKYKLSSWSSSNKRAVVKVYGHNGSSHAGVCLTLTIKWVN